MINPLVTNDNPRNKANRNLEPMNHPKKRVISSSKASRLPPPKLCDKLGIFMIDGLKLDSNDTGSTRFSLIFLPDLIL